MVRDRELFYRAMKCYLTVLTIAYVGFVLYPTVAPRPDSIVGTGFAAYCLRAQYALDWPYNCFPSLHVAHSFVSALTAHRDRIDALIGPHDGLTTIAPRLRSLAGDADPWLAAAGAAFLKGSPTSAALALSLQRRLRHASLAEVLRLEYQASVGCCVHPDFAEGVRALLIDKDKSPRWQPAAIDESGEARVDALLAPRFDGPHPLADLR